MKTLVATYFEGINSESDLFRISDLLDHTTCHPIRISPWKEFSANVTANFSIAHGVDSIFLKYYILEPFSKAVHLNPNDPVYKDSCVEFFLGFNGEPDYYNFEFNNAGNCLFGFGTGTRRKPVPAALIAKIKYARSFKNTAPEGLFHWELTLAIPFEVFSFHKIYTLNGVTCKANFYKCGDDLPSPHYLTWNSITSEAPNFHLPEFFGAIDFT